MSGSSPTSPWWRMPRVANHRRKGAGGAANDDVLRRMPLQPYRIDDGVKEDREGEQSRRADVAHQGQNGDRPAGKTKSEHQRFKARDLAARDRTPCRARHHGVDVGVVPHVGGLPAAPAPAAIATMAMDPGSASRWPGAIINPTSAVRELSSIIAHTM